MDAETKLSMIRDMCRHPGTHHWSGRDVADAITKILDDNPIAYRLADLDHPIPYELVHDYCHQEDDK